MRKEVDKVIKSGALGLNVTPTGETFATAPTPANANDNSTKIATTAWVRKTLNTSGSALGTWNKAANGYLKFSNGIILQWGTFTAPSYIQTKEITFPVAHTTANIKVMFSSNYKQGSGDKGSSCSVTALTTTKFTFYSGFEGTAPTVYWFSIGY